MIHKKVVRDFHVWCAKSKIRISEIGGGTDSTHWFGKKLSERDVDRILSEVFGEKLDSQTVTTAIVFIIQMLFEARRIRIFCAPLFWIKTMLYALMTMEISFYITIRTDRASDFLGTIPGLSRVLEKSAKTGVRMKY